MENIFDPFIGKYSLSKTLRFELKPVGKTEDFLKTNKVFEKDQTIDDSYNQAKFYFVTLHQHFINESFALEKAKNLPFSKLADFLERQNKEIFTKREALAEARKNKDEKVISSIQKEINEIENKI